MLLGREALAAINLEQLGPLCADAVHRTSRPFRQASTVIAPHFYLNAYNITDHQIDDLPNNDIRRLRAALIAFPFIYGPYRLNGKLYYEGAVVDCLNFKDLVDGTPARGLETVVVLDVLGSDRLIREPRNIYDSWMLSMMIPLVEDAEDDLELFALKHNKGWRRSRRCRPIC